MSRNGLSGMGLGLAAPWKVVKSALRETEGGHKTLVPEPGFEPGARFACPECGQMCPAHGTVWRRWRHLDFRRHTTELGARVPGVRCGEHGVRQAAVPWARGKSGSTLMFGALAMMPAAEMPVAAVARMAGGHDTRLRRVVRHHAGEARKRQYRSGVDSAAAGGTATRKGHGYAPAAVDLDRKGERGARLLFMTPGRTAGCVGEFVAAMEARGAAPGRTGLAAIGMGPACKLWIAENIQPAAAGPGRPGALPQAGPNHRGTPGGHARLLPRPRHTGRHGGGQRTDPDRPPQGARLPQLREPPGHLLLDGRQARSQGSADVCP